MNILLNEPAMRSHFDTYCNFLNSVYRFQASCLMGLCKHREDFLTQVGSLENALAILTKTINFANAGMFGGLLKRLRLIIAAPSSIEDIAVNCESQVREFLYLREDGFRSDYLDACTRRLALETYSYDLMAAAMDDLKDGKYDAAVQAAFKALDLHLQRILKLPPAEHGEGLFNKAFAPDSGALKLGGDANEQRGLRNLASGANAVFRNAVAHKFVFTLDHQSLIEATADAISSGQWPATFYKSFYDEMTAQTIIAIVALLMKAATKLALENKVIDPAEASRFAFAG
jgi:hypothetical protein